MATQSVSQEKSPGGRCLPASAWLPLETPLARFRVWKVVCELALLVCDNVWYYVMVLSCLQVVFLVACFQRGLSGRTFSGVPVLFLNLECYCAAGGGYLGGGAPAPRYQGPPGATLQRSGAAHGPLHPAVFFLEAVLLCVWYLVRVWDSCLGNLKRSGALGLLSCILSPLSFGPVRFLAFPVLGSQGGGALSRRLLFF